MRKLLGFAALLAAVAACDSNSPTALPPQLSNVIQSTTLLNVDDAFSAVAEVLPSFGGLSYDAAGNIQVFMRPPYDEAQTVAVLTEFLTERSSPYESKSFQWRFVTAQYTWPELLAIRRAVSPLTVTSGFVYLDADESNNRVTIAVSNAEAERYIRSAITVSGIDERAIGFIRLGPMVPMTTLRERIRPIPAGFVTGWQYPGISSECTHGFNVRRAPDDGYIYFLMNDHCSGARATVDGTTYYQPYTGPLQDVIGTEVVDPGYFDNNSDPACEVGFVCRYSDANLVRYSVSASDFGGVALTESMGLHEGSITLSQWFDGRSAIVWAADPLSGQGVSKTGYNTGWTGGRVTATCTTSGVQGLPNLRLICQSLADGGVGQGDSGSPVVEIAYFGEYATARGLVWGGQTQAHGDPTSYMIFSPVSGLARDLGGLVYY